MYIVQACVDQAEALNNALLANNLPSYAIEEILPSVRYSLTLDKYKDALVSGTQGHLMNTLDTSYKGYSTFKEIVWKDDSTVFGSIVCSIIFIVSTVADFSKFLNPIMLSHPKSTIGKFLIGIKNIYALVSHLVLC